MFTVAHPNCANTLFLSPFETRRCSSVSRYVGALTVVVGWPGDCGCLGLRMVVLCRPWVGWIVVVGPADGG